VEFLASADACLPFGAIDYHGGVGPP